MTLFSKRYACHGLCVLAITGLICLFVGTLSFNAMFLDPVGQAIKSFRFTDSYFYIENNSKEITDANMDVVLFDLSGCYSRTEIAAAVQKLYDSGAKVIALDVIFGNSMAQGKEANDSLMNVMARCHDRIVSACRAVPTVEGFNFESSYFVGVAGCREACVNMENDVVRTFGPKLCFGDTCLPSFVDVICQMAYPDQYSAFEKRANEEELINYRRIVFNRIHIYDEFYGEDVDGKVVLIGDLEDLRDFHSVPVDIDGSNRISGTIIHAYALSTITKNRMINLMSDAFGLVIGLLVSFLFCVLCCQVSEKYDKISGLVMNVYQVILLLLMAFVGGIVFLKLNYNINLIYAMLGIGLAGFSTDLWYYVVTTRGYKWLRRCLPVVWHRLCQVKRVLLAAKRERKTKKKNQQSE